MSKCVYRALPDLADFDAAEDDDGVAVMQLETDRPSKRSGRVSGRLRNHLTVQQDFDSRMPDLDLNPVPIILPKRAFPGVIEKIDAAGVERIAGVVFQLDFVADVGRGFLGIVIGRNGKPGAGGIANGNSTISVETKPIFRAQVELVEGLFGIEPGLVDVGVQVALAGEQAVRGDAPKTIADHLPSVQVLAIEQLMEFRSRLPVQGLGKQKEDHASESHQVRSVSDKARLRNEARNAKRSQNRKPGGSCESSPGGYEGDLRDFAERRMKSVAGLGLRSHNGDFLIAGRQGFYDLAPEIFVQREKRIGLQFPENPPEFLLNAVHGVEEYSTIDVELPAAKFPVRAQKEMKTKDLVFEFIQTSLRDQAEIRHVLLVAPSPCPPARLAPLTKLPGHFTDLFFLGCAILKPRKASPKNST